MDEDIFELRDRILVRVRAGIPISVAIKAEQNYSAAYRAYYLKLSADDRAPVLAARKEYLAMQDQRPERPNMELKVDMPTARYAAFYAQCDQMNVSMSRRVNSLIVADLNARKNVF